MQSSPRCAIITGGGRGLGRAYGELLATQGYAVIVNDRDAASARETVEAIGARGGVAWASHHDVEDPKAGQDIVNLALEKAEHVDVVIANAGYLCDRSFGKMSADEFDSMVRVHLLGTAHVLRAAWPALAASGAARVVMTTSSASLWGNFGQANYAAAKAGVVGLMLSTVEEGARHGIGINTIAPYAMTRLGDGIFNPAIAERMATHEVATVVAYLCSADCALSGEILEVGAGRITRARLMRSEGLSVEQNATPDDISGTLDALMRQPIDRSFDSARESFADHIAHLDITGTMPLDREATPSGIL